MSSFFSPSQDAFQYLNPPIFTEIEALSLSKQRIIQRNLVHFHGFPDRLYDKELLYSNILLFTFSPLTYPSFFLIIIGLPTLLSFFAKTSFDGGKMGGNNVLKRLLWGGIEVESHFFIFSMEFIFCFFSPSPSPSGLFVLV